MFKVLEDPGDRPGEISRFVWLWLAGLAAILLLLLAIARWRSNVARWCMSCCCGSA
jgi:hypothetical protein